MTARAYYNDTSKAACAVLREQIASGVIPFGDVDDRSIKDVQPDDLRGYTQCHFFAGGGLWGVAARLAGWPDARPLWTGSCPCQPFSVAGKGAGRDDPRHLWPHFHRLIRAARPPVVMGEQVAGKAGYDWLDGVRADLAGEDYASRGIDIPALAVDAPHERNRLYWLAVDDTVCDGQREPQHQVCTGRHAFNHADGGLVHGPSIGRGEGRPEHVVHSGRSASPGSDACGFDMVDRDDERREELCGAVPVRPEQPRSECSVGRNGSFWADAEWIICHDQKARRTFSRVSGLAYGLPGMLAQLGNDSFVEAQAEIIAYAETANARPAEILRAVRDGVISSCSEAPQKPGWWSGDGLGGPEGFCASQVLLHFLREYDRRSDGGRSVLAVHKTSGRSVRSLRRTGEPAQPSCGREHLQQHPSQPANSLRELSYLLARHAEKAGEAVGASDAKGLGLLTPSFPGRVDLWSIAGNAISPVLAAEVIAAFLDVEGSRQ